MTTEQMVLQYGLAALAAVLGIVLLLSGFKSLRRKRLIENVPTSKVQGVFMGLTEVKGSTERDPPLTSYLGECPCVWYSYAVQEHWQKTETYTDSQGRTRTRTSSGWTTVGSGEIREPFLVRDDTGRIRVVPEGAEVEGHLVFDRHCGPMDPIYYGKGPAHSIMHSTHRRRFTEHAIRTGARVYTIGTARLREDLVEPEIAHGPEDEMYLISVKDEEKIVRSYAIGAIAKSILGFIFVNAAPWAWFGLARQDAAAGLRDAAPLMIGASLLYAVAIFVHYLFTLYNGLVSVRNRVRMAWSQIDIQLKRRHDLIPNLVACVKRFAKHEAEVHADLAEYRAGARSVADAASHAGSQTRALGGLFLLAEKYPEIKADGSFLKLNEELARTETKIALARAFYNESVTALNNRIETLPDALIARPANFRKEEWFRIDEFEKHPVEVKFEAAPEAPPPPPPKSETAAAEAAEERR